MKIQWSEVVIVFVIGVFIGWLAACGAVQCRMHNFKPEKMVERFSHELGLNADQKEKVSKILETTRAQMMSLRGEMKPKFEQIRNVSKAEIRKLLTPEQQQKFDKLSAKWESNREKRRPQWSD